MLVRFLTSVAGVNFAYRPKRVYDLPEHLAREFIKARQAEPVIEEAVTVQPEVAARRRRRFH